MHSFETMSTNETGESLLPPQVTLFLPVKEKRLFRESAGIVQSYFSSANNHPAPISSSKPNVIEDEIRVRIHDDLFAFHEVPVVDPPSANGVRSSLPLPFHFIGCQLHKLIGDIAEVRHRRNDGDGVTHRRTKSCIRIHFGEKCVNLSHGIPV